MEKILNTRGLGVSGRQNELIELALTFKFHSVEVDMNDLIGRHDTMGKEFACQFLKSAKIKIGTFELPINLDSTDEEFNKACEKLDTIFSLCETLGGKRCRTSIVTSSNEAFQANFERHRARLFELGEKFAAHDMVLGVALKLPSANEKENKFIRSPEELMTLVKTVGHKNVGMYLDTWQWRACGGDMDQIRNVDPAKVTELAMADFSTDTDPAKIVESHRVLPGKIKPSFSEQVFTLLRSKGYDGPVSFATHLVTFANVSRDLIVNRISKRLDCMISGEPLESLEDRVVAPVAVEKPAEAEIENVDAASTEVEVDATKEDSGTVAATK